MERSVGQTRTVSSTGDVKLTVREKMRTSEFLSSGDIAVTHGELDQALQRTGQLMTVVLHDLRREVGRIV